VNVAGLLLARRYVTTLSAQAGRGARSPTRVADLKIESFDLGFV
jgi:hypothetical protein